MGDHAQRIIGVALKLFPIKFRRFRGPRPRVFEPAADQVAAIGKRVGHYQRRRSGHVQNRVLAIELEESRAVADVYFGVGKFDRARIAVKSCRWFRMANKHILNVRDIEQQRCAGSVPAGPNGIVGLGDHRPDLSRLGYQERIDPQRGLEVLRERGSSRHASQSCDSRNRRRAADESALSHGRFSFFELGRSGRRSSAARNSRIHAKRPAITCKAPRWACSLSQSPLSW